MKSIVRRTIFLCGLLVSFGISKAEEILVHSGPIVTTPALGLKLPNREIPGEEIRYRKQFFVDSEKLAGSFHTSEIPSLSAVRAIELATERGGLPNDTRVVRLDLLSAEIDGQGRIDYYLIEYAVDGSTEHRVILMNELVLDPQLEKLAQEQN